MHEEPHVYIDGAWVSPATPAWIETRSAITGEVHGRVPACSEQELQQALAAAQRAAPGWAATAPAQRSRYLAKIADLLAEQRDALARLVSSEVGMPYKLSARIQIDVPVQAWRAFATLATEYPFETRHGNSLIVREPMGVAACITPWNYPLHQVTGKVAAALAAGCTVVLKPSEVAPLSAFALCRAVHEAGLPPGVLNMVTGDGRVLGEALVSAAEVDVVSFTGSTAVGRRVMELASRSIKRVALELGGKSAAVVLDDADLALVVRRTVTACFLNSGQTCSALTRLLIPQDRYEEARELAARAAATFLVGDPFQPETRMGPLASAKQLERARALVEQGLAEGAELVAGGPQTPPGCGGGYFMQPTVLGRVAPDATIAQVEVFGPVLSIITFRDEEEAIRIANGTRYGLAASVWSADAQRALSVARRLKAGQVEVNGAPFNETAPFGGYRESGIGRENGRFGLETFLEVKSIQLPA
ncbi:MAG: aldehyde dehydrogenase family protein [Burkholderiaceae bacterium]|nr:aldehyde dehydrogenase family protein [Burkholderiaceae bacterium]MDO9088681.1 aldehyde dehydrogenase family protein [Burkholderiaceae bacterium]